MKHYLLSIVLIYQIQSVQSAPIEYLKFNSQNDFASYSKSISGVSQLFNGEIVTPENKGTNLLGLQLTANKLEGVNTVRDNTANYCNPNDILYLVCFPFELITDVLLVGKEKIPDINMDLNYSKFIANNMSIGASILLSNPLYEVNAYTVDYNFWLKNTDSSIVNKKINITYTNTTYINFNNTTAVEKTILKYHGLSVSYTISPIKNRFFIPYIGLGLVTSEVIPVDTNKNTIALKTVKNNLSLLTIGVIRKYKDFNLGTTFRLIGDKENVTFNFDYIF